ncbi:MAG: Hef nuclease, partial [Nanoarchaeota archaeon]|nr:Hef nuclease [Nanoarchaeota archaeon]
GMLATIAVSYGIPIIYSKNYKETSSYLHIIAKREQEEGKRDFNLHGERKPLTLKEQQEYIISSLPGVGPGLARPLLKKFKTVKKVVNAKQEKLEKVEKIGPKKAAEIKRVTESEYE